MKARNTAEETRDKRKCIGCGATIPNGSFACPEHRSEALQWAVERQFGRFKKVWRSATGVAYKVPIYHHPPDNRALIGYPVWGVDDDHRVTPGSNEHGQGGIWVDDDVFIPHIQTDVFVASRRRHRSPFIKGKCSWCEYDYQCMGGTPLPNFLPDFLEETCSRCGEKVYLSPCIQALQARFPQVPIVCLPCMAAKREKVQRG